MNLQGILNENINQDMISNMSQMLGANEGAVNNAVQAALPVLIVARARNASQEQGAQALDNALATDHDGSILDNLMGVLSGASSRQGAGILGHIFGNKQPVVEGGISQQRGLDAATVGKLLMMLAPIVIGTLGKAKREQGLDANGVATVLDNERQGQESTSPIGGRLSQRLDQNQDESSVDDVLRMVGGMMNRGG